MQAILLIGPTGSGKSPLGNWLASNGWHGRRCRHFDFGAHLRAGTGLTAQERAFVDGLLAGGGLLENENFPIAEKILRAAVAGDEDALIILNGLPRHVGQARSLEPILAMLGVVVLQADAATILARLAHNRGGDRTGRVDDDLALVQRKLAIFAERTAPLEAYYRARGTPVWPVQLGAQTSAAQMAAQLGWCAPAQ